MVTKWMPAATNNFERTRGDEKIDLIVLHWSGGETLQQTDIKFSDANRLASSHLAIENSEIHQYVKDDAVAFHSGSTGVDKRSLGIICIGGVNMPIADATYQTLALVIEELSRKYRLPIDRDHIKGHGEISHSFCPGSLDLSRVVEEAYALSPKTIMDKLRSEKEELQDALVLEKRKSDTAEARIEEVRLILAKKDEQYTEKIEEYIYLEERNGKLETIVKDLLGDKRKLLNEKNRSTFTKIRDKLMKRFT